MKTTGKETEQPTTINGDGDKSIANQKAMLIAGFGGGVAISGALAFGMAAIHGKPIGAKGAMAMFAVGIVIIVASRFMLKSK